MTSPLAREIAARIWCDREMATVNMDVALAERIAGMIEVVLLRDLAERAMGLLCNVDGGDLSKQSPKWRRAVSFWLDRYHRGVS